MKLIKPSVEYIPQNNSVDGIYRHIERCARTCYKSEDKITEDSAKKMVDAFIKNKHTAMLEHGTVYLGKLWIGSVCHFCNQTMADEFIDKYAMNPYSKVVVHNNDICVSTNYRVLVENNWLDDLKYLCQPTEHHQKRYTMKFTCARIDSQSITRYRTNSFAQESQRFINYLQEIRGASVTFSEPIWVKPEDLEELKQDAAISERLYFKWINKGYKPEEARYFLINGTKTEIIVTAFEDDWRYFLDQRLRNTTGKPSSDMHHLAQLLWNEFKDKLNLEL